MDRAGSACSYVSVDRDHSGAAHGSKDEGEMAKFLISTMPETGHIYPALPIATALAAPAATRSGGTLGLTSPTK
ncbi:hypothetical protein [Fodinicola feengrottensis]|uniref:hypothetical protein n=1 Tax=Fodinicola feengrottensis TaxID=435914 RepID=UPI0013D855FD|nr:hypothetical protein [Fodinicola feengrottensis]